MFSGLKKHEEQRQNLCARGRDNAITAAFCGTKAPPVSGLVDVEKLVGLGFTDNQGPAFALTAHSTSLAEREVSAINPRAVLVALPDDRGDHNSIALGYARGEPFVEMAVGAPDKGLAFYLLVYEQACDSTQAGCTPAQRLTPATESGWQNWTLYDDKDLRDTVVDCLACHQPEGPSGKRFYRMQEFANPWTHWLASFTEGGNALVSDFNAVHGGETFAGIPPGRVATGAPFSVENLIRATGDATQPNEFPSPVIEAEVKASNDNEPASDSPPGQSATWQALYQSAVDGTAIPPPYHDVKITDAQKLAVMVRAYRDFAAGARPDLPDIRDVLLDEALADMSQRPKPGLDGKGIMVHMCSQCHNDRLDQTLSRARFNPAHLDDMSAAEKQVAVDRLGRAADDRLRMPPHLVRDLGADDITACIAALR
ncbi:MAG TPA: hypothetical protein VGO62_15150 [Myxococcota bacterium]